MDYGTNLYLYFDPLLHFDKVTTIRLGRDKEGAENSKVVLHLLMHEDNKTRAPAMWMEVDYVTGRQKDVLWAFGIKGHKYDARLDSLHDVAKTMHDHFHAGTIEEWKQVLKDFLVHPFQDCLR